MIRTSYKQREIHTQRQTRSLTLFTSGKQSCHAPFIRNYNELVKEHVSKSFLIAAFMALLSPTDVSK